MRNKITRRKFIKLTLFVGSIIGASTVFGLGGKVAPGKEKNVNNLVRKRKKSSNNLFNPREYAIAAVLADLIVPSDETGPGALDADVVNSLDRWLLAESQRRQTLYIEGLSAFDELARHNYNQGFIELTHKQQIDLLKLVDRAHEELELGDYSLLSRISRKFKYYKYTKWEGLGATISMFPALVVDVKRTFYTSQIAWDWLGYDGPPQPRGYIGRISKCF